jgi:hypothetical protein
MQLWFKFFDMVFLQMICEDRGIFLEIADFIKGLGLTILRGVMEARKSKIWARFTVEVIQPDVKYVTVSLELWNAAADSLTMHVEWISIALHPCLCFSLLVVANVEWISIALHPFIKSFNTGKLT